MKELTIPQVRMLTKMLRADGRVSPAKRADTRVLGNLQSAELVEGGFNEGFLLNLAGLAALKRYRSIRFALEGSMVTLEYLREVEQASL